MTTKTLPAYEIEVKVTFKLPELYNMAESLFEEEKYDLAAIFYKECAKAGLSNGLYSLAHLYQRGLGDVTVGDLEKSAKEFFHSTIKATPASDYDLADMV